MKEALKFLNKPLTIRWYLLTSPFTTKAFLRIEIRDPNFISSNIQNPGPKIG